jgi:hypothetical protein
VGQYTADSGKIPILRIYIIHHLRGKIKMYFGKFSANSLTLDAFCLACVSKFARQHFRHLFLHFRVFKPRFTASKPSVFILELQENLLETAPVSF